MFCNGITRLVSPGVLLPFTPILFSIWLFYFAASLLFLCKKIYIYLKNKNSVLLAPSVSIWGGWGQSAITQRGEKKGGQDFKAGPGEAPGSPSLGCYRNSEEEMLGGGGGGAAFSHCSLPRVCVAGSDRTEKKNKSTPTPPPPPFHFFLRPRKQRKLQA